MQQTSNTYPQPICGLVYLRIYIISFVNYTNQFAKLDIISLNHDKLLELLLERVAHRPYSDGYTRNQEILKYNDTSLNVFMSDFQEEVSLIKLHGSIDTYRYDYYEDKGAVASPTGEYLYYKTNNYYEKQMPERYDPAIGKKVQRIHLQINPEFITGTNKDEIIASDSMYAALYDEFRKRIHSNATLLIIGYSFADLHVNTQIESAIASGVVKEIIHVNPSIEFPKGMLNNNVKVRNLKYIRDIN